MNTLEDRIEAGAQLKRKMNCCQAVLMAYADRLGKSEDELMRRSRSFQGQPSAATSRVSAPARFFAVAKTAFVTQSAP
jgi:hypothetical protein